MSPMAASWATNITGGRPLRSEIFAPPAKMPWCEQAGAIWERREGGENPRNKLAFRAVPNWNLWVLEL